MGIERKKTQYKKKDKGKDDDPEDAEDEEGKVATPQGAQPVIIISEDLDEHDIELQSFANIVLDEYPRALRDTDLFIDVLNQFGIADDPAIRARALEIVREKKADLQARALAEEIATAEKRGEPESCVSALRACGDSQESFPKDRKSPLSPKRPRLGEACSSRGPASASSPSSTPILSSAVAAPWRINLCARAPI